MGSNKRRSSGQAIVEFILMLVVALSLVAVLNNQMRKTVINVWEFYFRQISASCPGCDPPPGTRFR